MPIPLRPDFDAPQLRALARKTKNGPQARRLLALAAVYEGATRTAQAVAPGAHALVLLDQAGWHQSKRLVVPDTITLMPLPARAPELNPVENVWQFLRDNWLSNRIFPSYEAILDHCCAAWNECPSRSILALACIEFGTGQGIRSSVPDSNPLSGEAAHRPSPRPMRGDVFHSPLRALLGSLFQAVVGFRLAMLRLMWSVMRLEYIYHWVIYDIRSGHKPGATA